jgi:hypothetical protein
MKRRRILLLLLGSVVAITLAIFIWPREREPEYNGVKLSKWLETYRDKKPEAKEAIEHIGTNALPFLVSWIQYERPAWRSWLNQFSRRLPSPLQNTRPVNWLLANNTETRADSAVNGFKVLGKDSSPAFEALQRLSENRKTPATQLRATECMLVTIQRFPDGDFVPF